MPGRKKEILPKPLSDAQLAANLKKENAALQKEFAGQKLELKRAAATIAATEKAGQGIAGELAQLKGRFPALQGISAEPASLWQGLKSVLEKSAGQEKKIGALEERVKKIEADADAAGNGFAAELKQRSALLERSLKKIEQERDEARQTLDSVRDELKGVVSREQNNQIKALAEITELREAAGKNRLALEALQKKTAETEVLWQREREGILRNLEKIQAEKDELAAALLERRQEDEQFAAALASLRDSYPLLEKVEARPEPVLRVLLKELLFGLSKVAEMEAELAEAEAKVVAAENLDQRIGKLLAENRQLQEQFDSLVANSRIFEQQAVESAKLLKEKVAAAVAEANARADLDRKSIVRNCDVLEAENSSLRAQLESSGKIAFVRPERVSLLLNDFYASIQNAFSGLDVRESEVRLKVGFGGLAEEQAGFVIPTAGNTQEIRDSLGEIVLRLGRKDI